MGTNASILSKYRSDQRFPQHPTETTQIRDPSPPTIPIPKPRFVGAPHPSSHMYGFRPSPTWQRGTWRGMPATSCLHLPSCLHRGIYQTNDDGKMVERPCRACLFVGNGCVVEVVGVIGMGGHAIGPSATALHNEKKTGIPKPAVPSLLK